MPLPQPTTLARHWISEALPEELREENMVIDGKKLQQLQAHLAQHYPDRYKDILFRLNQIAADAQGSRGGVSPSIRHLRESKAWQTRKEKLRKEIQAIYRNPKLDLKQKQAFVQARLSELSPTLTKEVFDEADAGNNPFAWVVKSGMKGKPANMNNLLGSPLQFTDPKGRIIPVPVLNGYARGLRPSEYWAAAYGTRKGVVDVKLSVADAGYLCLAEGTLVRMADFSVKRIEDIRLGDMVLGVDDSLVARPVRVNATFDNGVRACYRTAFYVGMSRRLTVALESTLDHKLYSELRYQCKVALPTVKNKKGRSEVSIRGTYPVGMLRAPSGQKLEKLAALPVNGIYAFSGVSEPMALLLGLLVGDGCYTHKSSAISFNKPDSLLISEVNQYLAQFNLEFRQTGATNPYQHLLVKVKDKYNPCVQNGAKQKLKDLNMWGRYSHEKVIPSQADTWDKRSLADFIGGYFATDGGVCVMTGRSGVTVHFGSTSKVLLEKLKELLESRFGILGDMISKTGKSNDSDAAYRKNDLYMFRICKRPDVELFFREIPIYGSKREVFERLLFETKDVPVKDVRKFYRYDQESIGDRHTYDIEVDSDNHLFVLANGLIVSNSKQLTQIAHRSVVTDDDDPDAVQDESRGLPVDLDDEDSIGSLLAQSVGGYKKNTIITAKVLRDLRRQGIERMLIRSPLVGGPQDGSVYARDVGVRETGRLPVRGENPGVTAAQAVGEILSQSMLSSKHSAGVAGQTAGAVGGFKAVNQLIQSPKESVNWAAHAKSDGMVQKVVDAPQGGKFVFINNEPAYVPTGQDVNVKSGDMVEAGDILSNGLPNPAMVVEHKGIGEGRRYFTKALMDVFKRDGVQVNRRNVELIARGLVNYVELDEEMDTYAPGDQVPYNMLEKYYQPREGAKEYAANNAVGKYLERPILHYTIGTKIRPSVVRELQAFGLDSNVLVHDSPPTFRPRMIRGAAIAQHDVDWLTGMYGSGIKSRVLEATHRGHSANPLGTSYVSGVIGDPNFASQNTKGKIVSPVYQLDEMKRRKQEAPNLWDDSDDDG